MGQVVGGGAKLAGVLNVVLGAGPGGGRKAKMGCMGQGDGLAIQRGGVALS